MTFRLIYEVAVPQAPDISKVLRQIEIFGPVVDAILVPDNHLGRVALSSVALGIEVKRSGFDPIVSLNARDRNLLRFRSDLLTLRAYGLNEVLLVYGDATTEARTGLKVREMLNHEAPEGMRRGATAVIGSPLRWRNRADFLFTQLAFGREKPGPWRESESYDRPIYCGVIALENGGLAAKFLQNIPGLDAPQGYLEAFKDDGEAGFRTALRELSELREAGADGAHLVVPAGWRHFAEMLSSWRHDSQKLEGTERVRPPEPNRSGA